MIDPKFENTSEWLAQLAQSLFDAPGIETYPTAFPRLSLKHLQYLADGHLTARTQAATLLTAAARQGASDPASAAQNYRERGELPALRAIADPETVARATMEWQRRIDQRLGDVEKLAALCDREGVRCKVDLTWAKWIKQLRERVTAEHADSPASQDALALRCMEQMQLALAEEKQRLRDRLRKAGDELEQKRDSLDEEAVRRGGEYADSVRKLIDDDDLISALRKLGLLEALVGGRYMRAVATGASRLPLAERRNPLGRKPFQFEALIGAAKRGVAEVARCALTDYLPDESALEDATDTNGFVSQNASRRLDWSRYFKALREWLGLTESRSSKRPRRLQKLDMPNLEPKGPNLPGRWIFLTAEPWQGAPFYEDLQGRPRVIAIVRLAIDDADRGRVPFVQKFAGQTLRELLLALPAESGDEQRFRNDGLIIVLLPGEILSGKKYDQFRQPVQLEKATRTSGRIAYLDDLDLLRLMPVPADDRFRALLELALPRFPDALSQTYQNSDAVRPRMFFGRSDELTRLENGTTVVFSGRKMGKSSLLHRLRAQCGAETDQRAIVVGCSGIASGRSWMVLREIERELVGLLHREQPEVTLSTLPPGYGPIDSTAEAMAAAKDRFRQVLDDAMRHLEGGHVRKLFVLLDEADNFVRAELEETSGGKGPRANVSWFLRDLQTGSYPGRLRFIFAGYDQIGRIFRDPGLGHSAFGNWGEQPLKLGPLDAQAARDLVVKPLAALGMRVSDDLVERILDYTSGHASLIQAFCRKLAERVHETQDVWPLNDATIEFEDLQVVADDQRGAGDQNYRQLLEQTLGLNLDIARAYPLKLIFLALVSSNGLGAGRVLGFDGFTIEDALDQVRPTQGEPVLDLTPTLVLDSLDLLAQLGLLEDVSDSSGRAFTFRARHYVNVLRTKNGFQAQLQQASDEWQRSSRRSSQIEPRYVWTLPDSDLWTLRQHDDRPAAVVGMPGSGRGYLADMLASPFVNGRTPILLEAHQPWFPARLGALFETPPSELVVVTDPSNHIPWEKLAGWLRRAREVGLSMRWVGGPRLAWDLARDLEVAVLINEPYSLGPLTAAELEPWAARELGGEGPPSAASVPDADRGTLLEVTSGLLPILELFREWLLRTQEHFPDPLRLTHAEAYRQALKENSTAAARAAERLARELPTELRLGLHHLYRGAEEWGEESYLRADLTEISPHLGGLSEDALTQLLDAAVWLRLLPAGTDMGQVRVPYNSVLGLLIRQPRFAGP